MKPLPLLLGLGLGLALAGCGSSQTAPSAQRDAPQEISEARALTLISETLLDLGYRLTSGVRVDVGWSDPLEVDIMVAGARFGIEWVSRVDRHERGDEIPAPAPDGQLRIMAKRGGSADVHVLVLESKTYEFQPSRESVQRGEAGAREVESRVRMDVRDFIAFERGRTGG